jgi:hypothetical protein
MEQVIPTLSCQGRLSAPLMSLQDLPRKPPSELSMRAEMGRINGVVQPAFTHLHRPKYFRTIEDSNNGELLKNHLHLFLAHN